MPSIISIGYVALQIAGALLSLWLATVDYRRGQRLAKQTTPTWPLEFPVFWLDYYLGPRLARYLRIGQVLVVGPMFALSAYDAIVRDGRPRAMSVLYVAAVATLMVRAYIPKTCRLDDLGIRFEHFYAWDAIRRWKFSQGRLIFVAERSAPHKILSHIEIPLNGLPPALLPWLEERLTARVVQPGRSRNFSRDNQASRCSGRSCKDGRAQTKTNRSA